MSILPNADTLHYPIHWANNVHASRLSNDRGGQQRQRLRAECRPCQEPILLVAMNHQHMQNRIPSQWYHSNFPSNPYHDSLEEHDRIKWSCLVRACSWTVPTVSRYGCRWGLVHVEVALQDPFLETIWLSGRLWHLLNWLLGSWHTGSLLMVRRTRCWSRRCLTIDWSWSFSPIFDLLRPIESVAYTRREQRSACRAHCLNVYEWLEDTPRPLTDGAEDTLVESVPLALPVPPVLTSRSAFAPKLIRRAICDVGEMFGSTSPSSTALSLMEVDGELPLPKLLCRFLMLVKADVWVGDPAMPSEAMEVRRRCWAWALAAAVAIGPG